MSSSECGQAQRKCGGGKVGQGAGEIVEALGLEGDGGDGCGDLETIDEAETGNEGAQ